MKKNKNKISPKVSVIIPVYNVEKYLRKCLESILNQTLKDIEVIVVNDGSTDSSLKIIQEYANKDSRIVIINKPNGGYATAINAGLGVAQGKYIAEVDSDDYVAQEMYQTLYDAAIENDVDVVISNYAEFVGENETFSQSIKKQVPNEYFNKILYPTSILEERKTELFGAISIWTGLYRRKLIQEKDILINDKVFCYNDTGFWFRTRALAKSIYFVDKAFYFYRNDVDGQTIKKLNDRFPIYIEEYFDVKADFEKRNLWNDVRDMWYLRFLPSCFYFILPRIEDENIEKFISLIKPTLKSLCNDTEYFNVFRNKLPEETLHKVQSILKNTSKFIADYIERKYRVSVVMPVYNSAKHLANTIPQIINQEFRDFEFIIVDDGSTDNSLETINLYSGDPRISVIKMQTNKGQSTARNIGLKAAKGKYIIFLDSDDDFVPKLLGDFWWHMNAHQLDVCMSGYSVYSCREKRQLYTNIHESLPKEVFTGKKLSPEQLKNIVGWNWDKMYRREFLLENNIKFPEDLRVSEDALVAYPAILLANRIFAMKWPLITYKEFGSTSVSTKMENHIIDNFRYYDKLHDFIKDQGMERTHERHFINIFIQHIIFAYETVVQKEHIREKIFDLLIGEYLTKFNIPVNLPDKYFADEDILRKYYLIRRMLKYSVGEHQYFSQDLKRIPLEVDSYKFGYEFKSENIIVLQPHVTQVVSNNQSNAENIEKIGANNLFSLLYKILTNGELRSRLFDFLIREL